MIHKLVVKNYLSEIFELELRSPEKSGFFISNIDGLGPSKAQINLTESLSSSGGFYNSSRSVSRNIVIDLGYYDDGSESIENIRQKSYKIFPVNKPVMLEIVSDNRVGVTTGIVESNTPIIFSKRSGTQISIICPSAYFQSKETFQTIFTGVEPLFEFPFENPSLTEPLIEFGSIFINTESSLVYLGDEDTGITIFIDIIGPVHNLSLHNLATSETMAINSDVLMAMTGQDLVAGDKIIISTSQGSKFIYLLRNGVYINILNTLGISSSWFRVFRGDNLFKYTTDTGLSNVKMLIEHNLKYGGL